MRVAATILQYTELHMQEPAYCGSKEATLAV